jgi:hypothetical protein
MPEFIRGRPRPKPSKDEAFYTAWGKAHDHCAACGRSGGGALDLSTHHIVKQGRAHEAANLLRLCIHPCHDLAEGLDVRVNGYLLPKITIGVALSMKMRSDPAEVDLARLQELRGSRLPDPEVIPAAFVLAYRRNRPPEATDA